MFRYNTNTINRAKMLILETTLLQRHNLKEAECCSYTLISISFNEIQNRFMKSLKSVVKN